MERRLVSSVFTVFLTLSLFVSAFSLVTNVVDSLWVGTDWNRTYGGTGIDVAYSVVQTSDGGYALAGLRNVGGNGDMWLVNTDSAGNHLWNKTYGGTNGECAYSMVKTGDGGYALAGYTQSYGVGSPYPNVYLVKTTASGVMAWNKTYGGTNEEYAYSVVQTSDGGYAIAGRTLSYGVGAPSHTNIYLVKTDSAGTMLWNKTYGGANGDESGWSVVQTSDGGYAIAGFTSSFGAGNADFYLVKTDSAGAMLWNKTYGGASWDQAYSVIQTSDGGYAVAGYTNSFGAGSNDFWLVKTDSAGAMLWSKTYGGAGGEIANCIVKTSDGGYAVAGYTDSFGAGNADFYLVKTDSAGAMLWSKTYGGTNTDVAYSVVQTGDGGYALAGDTYSFGAGADDFWLVKLTPATIYIRASGSIDPPSAPLVRDGNIYTLNDDVYSTTATAIVIEKDGIILDGAGHMLQGPGSGVTTGILMQGRSYVTIKNVKINAFSYGINLRSSCSNNVILSNNMANNGVSTVLSSSSYNTITGNVVTGNWNDSIQLIGSSNNAIRANKIENGTMGDIHLDASSNYNTISENNITNDYYGIRIYYSANNNLFGNKIKSNGNTGIYLYSSPNNAIYHNNFLNNNHQAYTDGSANMWDEGYPSGGNYWSDYIGVDTCKGPYQNMTGSDGIGDAPRIIDLNNRDNYPLMAAWAPHSSQYPWSMFHYDLTHAGYSDSPTSRTNQKKWSYATGNTVRSSAAIVDGKVYIGSNDGKLYCFNALNGTLKWSHLIGGPVESSPAVADGKVYVTSYIGNVSCLDASTGAYIWNYPTGASERSSPAVVNGRVYIGSANGRILCLNSSNGANIWSHATGGPVYSSPAIVGDKVFIGSYDFKVYCLDASTGASVWNYTAAGSIYSSPAVFDGKVYFGCLNNWVYCLEASTGTYKWHYVTGGKVFSSPAVAYGKIYVGSCDSKVYCINASNGESKWIYLTSGSVNCSSPALADGKVYFGSSDSKVYCLDASNSGSIWSYTTSGAVYSSPSVADGVVFVGSDDHALYAFGSIIKVPEDYPTVQAAVNAAPSGATILIAPGIYRESVIIVNKTLTILGEKGSGTTFQGGGSGTAFTIGPGAGGTNVAQVTIISYALGVSIDNSAQCRIFDNIMYSMTDSGVAVKGSNAANTLIYDNTFQNNYIALNLTQLSTSNTIYGNIITLNSIGLYLKTGGNTIYANTISQNTAGINLANSNNNAIYWNNFESNTQQVVASSSTGNVWDEGYPNGGNYWSTYTGLDIHSGPTTPQTQDGPDGIGDSAYTVYSDVQDHYPLMKPFGGSHDIGIVDVTCSKTVVGQGYILTVTVRIMSYSIYTDTRNIKVYAGSTIAASQDNSIPYRSCANWTFTWDTTNYAKGNYVIKAYATPITDDVDTDDNTRQGSSVIITIPGDINGDKTVNNLDLYMLSRAYLTQQGMQNWNPNANINNDSIINKDDMSILSHNFGKSF